MALSNCKLMFTSKYFLGKQLLSTDLVNVRVGSKYKSSVLKPARKSISNSKEKILNYILKSEIKPFLNESQLQLLTPLFQSNKHFRIFYKFVVNYNVARDIVDKIQPHIDPTKDIVVEANPGLGFITLCLLNSDIKKITLVDKSEITKCSINQLIELHQDKLELINVNLFKCPGQLITDLIENSIKFESTSKVIGIMTNNTFLINLMYTYVLNELWNSMQYLEFYLVISSTVWNNIVTCSMRDSRYFYHFLFNFMFQCETLGQYPHDAFVPVASNDKNQMTLVKITTNSTLINRINKDDLKTYVFFLDVLTRNRQTFIIPSLEKYVPNCGPYLISKGVSMSNTIRDFSPSDSPVLFNIFKECEGYDYFKSLNFKFCRRYQMEMQDVL